MLSFVEVDRDHDVAYILLKPKLRDRRAIVARSISVADDIVLDLDSKDQPIGIELLRASAHLDLDHLAEGLSELIVGVDEAADMLAVERSRLLSDLINGPDFPPPIAEFGDARFWLRPALQRYVARRHQAAAPPTRGRPRSKTRS